MPEEKRFWVHDGKYLKNLGEMEAELRTMSEETFHYHVNEAKNDFGQWVHDVIGDDKLTRDLQKSVNKAQAAHCIANRIDWLRQRS